MQIRLFESSSSSLLCLSDVYSERVSNGDYMPRFESVCREFVVLTAQLSELIHNSRSKFEVLEYFRVAIFFKLCMRNICSFFDLCLLKILSG